MENNNNITPITPDTKNSELEREMFNKYIALQEKQVNSIAVIK